MSYYIEDIRATEEHLKHIGAVKKSEAILLSKKEPFAPLYNTTSFIRAKQFRTEEKALLWLATQDCSLKYYRVISFDEILSRHKLKFNKVDINSFRN